MNSHDTLWLKIIMKSKAQTGLRCIIAPYCPQREHMSLASSFVFLKYWKMLLYTCSDWQHTSSIWISHLNAVPFQIVCPSLSITSPWIWTESLFSPEENLSPPPLQTAQLSLTVYNILYQTNKKEPTQSYIKLSLQTSDAWDMNVCTTSNN